MSSNSKIKQDREEREARLKRIRQARKKRHRRMFIRTLVIVLLLAGAAGGLAHKALNRSASSSAKTSTTSAKKTCNDPAANEYKSKVDKNKDGIDDQTEILQGALKYVKTKPHYQSEYYQGGWPTDGNGVCTDVVNYALLNAGYNMHTLVSKDIEKHPGWYTTVSVPDPNIDFRRVENLYAYLKHHAKSLTTNIHDTDQWQGGDIVVFKEHIGVVSAKRDKNGIAYIIHNGKPTQKSYIQDILPKKEKEIIGHFRIS
ncbi:MAG: DUF1287 domain-containing protein [Eubacterium sp.]